MRGQPRGGRWRGNRGNQGNRGSWPRGGSSRGFEGRGRSNYGRQNANQHWGKPKRDVPSKRLSEQDIGVTKYINEHEGFNGIIKTRFSDFQVSEINEQGEVAKLTDLSTPAVPRDEEVVDDEDLLHNKYNPEILPMETWDRINKVATTTGSDVEKVQVDVTGMTKEQRTKIHDAVKKAFGESIVGSTITVDDKKYVTFDKYRKGVRIDNRVKWVWPGEYVYFIVYKENCDTMEAASRIAARLRLQVRSTLLGYAGTKDRRAKTSQWFSLRKFDPRKIANACRDLRDIQVGNYSFRDTNLKLGMLKGNQFRICLRNVTASDECVDEACKLLREKGFLNYYGLQRFGTRIEVPTYEIGKKLLQGNFREAIQSILGERSGPMSRALHLYHTVSAYAALQALPHSAPPTEAKLIQALAQNENDLIGAMDQVARNVRLLYIHSYQSLIWNRVVSERLQRFPHQPVPGDLVPLADVKDDGIEELEDEESEKDETELNGAEKKTTDDIPEKDSIDSKNTNNLHFKSKTMIPVKVLTQEDCDSGRYSIFDVVMPLPGYSIEYPPNMKEYYKELLTKDDLKLDMKHKYKSYSMCGGYRHVVARPADMSWRCVRYSQPHADLILSDADELAGRTTTGATDDGQYKALLLTMSLPPSSYATMALRELLKVDTSGDNQALQNNYHQKPAKDDQKDDQKDGQPDQNEEDATDEQCEDVEKVEKRKLEEDSEGVGVKKTKQNDG
ncbi:pseudouridylate synthase 7 homolog [Maniola jurtina]|uniref:pseudouridylate synthase 7 homolog n=1 Tax=Maniola jurtina TaxID=191418 RepID=UPI001E68819D|nr:pseudouridylate synthase 7 homolog [Maniola jurtina]XP_045764951.1 pseudouridylate synthase 7 homolog [Maniola jurtina]XP_045764952.1 pseudouridylate synthase 7 homolog [Maniola jurtina]